LVQVKILTFSSSLFRQRLRHDFIEVYYLSVLLYFDSNAEWEVWLETSFSSSLFRPDVMGIQIYINNFQFFFISTHHIFTTVNKIRLSVLLYFDTIDSIVTRGVKDFQFFFISTIVDGIFRYQWSDFQFFFISTSYLPSFEYKERTFSSSLFRQWVRHRK